MQGEEDRPLSAFALSFLMEKNKIFLDKNWLDNEIINFSTLFANGPGNDRLIKYQFRGLRSKKSTSIMLPKGQLQPKGYILKRREIFFSIILVIFLLIGGCGGDGGGSSEGTGGTISLAWDANTEPDLAGYKIYYGALSRNNPSFVAYEHSIDVGMASQSGNTVTSTLAGLTKGQTYYISAKAYDTSNNESEFSDEVSGAAK